MNVTGTTVCAVEESASIPLEATGVNVQMAMSSPQIRRPVKMSMNALTRAAYVQMDTVRTTWVDMNVSVRLDTLIIKPKPDVLILMNAGSIKADASQYVLIRLEVTSAVVIQDTNSFLTTKIAKISTNVKRIQIFVAEGNVLIYQGHIGVPA